MRTAGMRFVEDDRDNFGEVSPVSAEFLNRLFVFHLPCDNDIHVDSTHNKVPKKEREQEHIQPCSVVSEELLIF